MTGRRKKIRFGEVGGLRRSREGFGFETQLYEPLEGFVGGQSDRCDRRHVDQDQKRRRVLENVVAGRALDRVRRGGRHEQGQERRTVGSKDDRRPAGHAQCHDEANEFGGVIARDEGKWRQAPCQSFDAAQDAKGRAPEAPARGAVWVERLSMTTRMRSASAAAWSGSTWCIQVRSAPSCNQRHPDRATLRDGL